jgi:hypothetical protein
MNQALNGQSAALRPRRQSALGFTASGSGHHQSEGLHAHHPAGLCNGLNLAQLFDALNLIERLSLEMIN